MEAAWRSLFRSTRSACKETPRSTEHLHLNGWLLRPGTYQLEVAADGAKAETKIEVHSHVRHSDFMTINWGRSTAGGQIIQGEDSLGYNLMYVNAPQENANFIRAGVDFMQNCTMGGGHQMDLRLECDWSDPYVTKAGTQRVVRRALTDRVYPNALGVHFYDEPGLTWGKDPENGEFGPHAVPAQAASFKRAFGADPLNYKKVDPNKPEDIARWEQWARWKLGIMDAAWAEAQQGVSLVKPEFLSVNQSQYGWTAFTDGYYFNVVRTLPIISGHGGYHDLPLDYFCPSYFLEMSRARDLARPNWYLPLWYGNATNDQFRMEQYLSFQTALQGLITPPDCEPATNPLMRQGIVESNHLMQRLGPIFTTMPPTRPPVAMLYSLSNCLRLQAKDRKIAYAHQTNQGQVMQYTYLAGKMIQQQFLAVLDEDILDGTLANNHKAVVLSGIEHLDAPIVERLEEFAAGGGLVLLAGKCTVPIKGAIDLGVDPKLPDQAKFDELIAAKKYEETVPYRTMGKYYQGAGPLAAALKTQLDKAGIQPVLESSLPSIAATRQAAGDVEYLLAVNATYDEAFRDAMGKVDPNAVKAASATIALAPDARPVYDAIVGGPVAELKTAGGKLSGEFRFGPGQMRVFARTARPIGGVRVATPIVGQDLTLERLPLRVDIAASVVDQQGGVLSGSIPVEVQVVDPLGVTRHELFRATRLGQFAASLPLAANDPQGTWTVKVRESLSGKTSEAKFQFTPLHARSLAGATARAVMFPDDIKHCFDYGRAFNEVTIVAGTGAFNEAAAARLSSSLEPWGIRSKRMPLAEAAKPRSLSAAEAATWSGLDFGAVKPGDANTVGQVGFAVQGPVILIGTPEDHPIIKFLVDRQFLPYAPLAGVLPGVGRGYVAWQSEGVGKGQQSITLIGYDDAGLNEAVGTLYEAIAGLKPLTRWEMPTHDAIVAATSPVGLTPAAQLAWQLRLPDSVLALKVAGEGLSAISHDGSATSIDKSGKPTGTTEADAAALAEARKPLAAPNADASKPFARQDRMLKFVTPSGERVAVAYWGGTLRVADAQGKVFTEQQLPQDITAVAWWNGQLLAGLADGRLMAFTVKP